MPPAAIIGGAALGSVVGGVIQGNAAKSAAEQQASAADRASQLQYNMYQQQREDQQPWRQAGMSALTQMQDPSFQKTFSMSDYQQDPGYAFRMAEGQKALERSAAAKGSLQSGGFAKALTQYGQNYASNEYNNAYNRFNNDQTTRFNRLSSLAGAGQTATNQMGAASQNYGQSAGNNYIGAGNAAAAGTIGQGNAYSGILSNLSNIGMQTYGMGQGGSGQNWMQKNIASQSPISGLNYNQSASSFWS